MAGIDNKAITNVNFNVDNTNNFADNEKSDKLKQSKVTSQSYAMLQNKITAEDKINALNSLNILDSKFKETYESDVVVKSEMPILYQNIIDGLTLDRRLEPGPANIESLYNCTPGYAAEIANVVLEIVKNDSELNQTRCVDIIALCRKFGIEVYKSSTLSRDVSGKIYAYGTTAELYNNPVVIINNGNESFEHRRFVTAHELGHFLFDCCGSSKYDSKNLLYAHTYKHPASKFPLREDQRADRFAAQLLMPSSTFRLQYMKAAKSELGKLLGREYIIDYLSKYFQVKSSSVERRIFELLEDGGF